MMTSPIDSIQVPDWGIPNQVKALFTTRLGGVSQPPYDSFNLATHVGDSLQDVLQNRQTLQSLAQLPTQPFWLDQQHTDKAIELTSSLISETLDEPPVADASWSKQKGCVAVVMTADCLPVLITNRQGDAVAAIHAGWKGLSQNIISKTINEMGCSTAELTAWIGPAISGRQFEVGQDVFEVFVQQSSANQMFFAPSPETEGKYYADLPAIAELEMQNLGVKEIVKSGLCSFEDSEHFYSYRRDGQTGRMASLIWIDD